MAGIWTGDGTDDHPVVDGTWSYEEEGVMEITGRDEPFLHVDRNTLRRIAAPTPNPRALAAAIRRSGDDGSLGIGSLRGSPTSAT